MPDRKRKEISGGNKMIYDDNDDKKMGKMICRINRKKTEKITRILSENYCGRVKDEDDGHLIEIFNTSPSVIFLHYNDHKSNRLEIRAGLLVSRRYSKMQLEDRIGSLKEIEENANKK